MPNLPPGPYSWAECRRQTKARGYGGMRSFFVCLPVAIDGFWRKADFRAHRSYGGLVSKYLKVDGHAPLAVVLPLGLLYFLIFGPTPGWRGPWGLLFLLAAWFVFLAGVRWFGRRHMLLFQLVLVLCVAGLMWLQSNHSEPDPALYRHVLIPLVVLLIAVPIVVSKILARYLFAKSREDKRQLFQRLLVATDLAVSPNYPHVTKMRIVRSFFSAPLRNPLILLFVPAVALLLAPYWMREWLVGITVVVAALTWLFLSLVELQPRLDEMLPVFRRAFFIGGPLLVSLGVILLAVGRLAEFEYVSTVVESSSLQIVLFYAACAYVSFWFYEYWINATLCSEFLGLFRKPTDPAGQVHFDVEPAVVDTGMEAAGRVLQIHGGARLIVIGKSHGQEVFQPYERLALLERMVDKAPLPVPERQAARAAVADLAGRSWFYFGVLNIVSVGIFLVTIWILLRLPEKAEAIVFDRGAAFQAVDLRRLLFERTQKDGSPNRRAILVAASGGGTRAALYTASLLHGLASEGALEDVVFAGGVSGGSAALAYFAAHRAALTAANSDRAWQDFSCTMSRPFIQEVLEGAAEWRIAAGTRWGDLLAESFKRNFGMPAEQSRIGQVRDVALVFNTTLAGQLRCVDCTQTEFDRFIAKPGNRELTRSDHAGARLILTNMTGAESFPGRTLAEAKEQHLNYVVVADPAVELTTAAALSANFPPVFSNAAIDANYQDRYWVTDGGATDNRGVESLLFALRDAISRQGSPAANVVLPEIHIVVAEASAFSVNYKQDRGIGSKFGAAEKLASQLMVELVAEIKKLYAHLGAPDGVHLHYLAMPDALRTRGGLGTHWMLPAQVNLTDPDPLKPGEADAYLIDSLSVRDWIDDLHQSSAGPRKTNCEDEGKVLRWSRHLNMTTPVEMNTARRWVTEEQQHRRRWNQLVSDLKKTQRGIAATKFGSGQ
ncbi:MAG: patatin-like phospholipase family protein [Acidobacteriota bacterium]